MNDPLFRPFGHHSAPDGGVRPESDRPALDDDRRPGPQLFVEVPLSFWVRRALMAAPCLIWAAAAFVSGFLALAFALIAAVTGRAPGSIGGSPAAVGTLLFVGLLSFLPGVLLAWQALLIMSRGRRARPWLWLLAFDAAATAAWSAVLIAARPELDLALVGVIFPYALLIAVLAVWRGQPDGVRLASP